MFESITKYSSLYMQMYKLYGVEGVVVVGKNKDIIFVDLL